MTTLFQTTQDRTTGFSTSSERIGITLASAAVFLIWAVILFFPLMYMLRFANQMKTALNANDQGSLNISFQNLKRFFRYLGVITIIGAGISIVWMLVVGVTLMNVH
jgi:hypothetical protein